MTDTTYRLRLDGISKSFPGVRALSEASLRVRPGEVHALLGENGAGKSTLMRILCGVFRADSGRILVDGEPVAGGMVAARRAGIAMIHQELQQVPELTVAQNMFLGRPLTHANLLVRRTEQQRIAAATLAELDASIRPDAPLKTLKVAQRQMVEIARALLERARIIAMDEPTSSLTPSEFERLAAVIGRLSNQGVSIIYISHKMDEVFRICRNATILRDGAVVGEADLTKTTEAAIVATMVGRTLAVAEHRSAATNTVVLSVRKLTHGRRVIDASFDLHRGEVLGVAGLIGAGRTELLRLIAGVDRPASGSIDLFGRPHTASSPRAAIRAGIGLVPEERKRGGIIPLRSAMINLALASMPHFAPHGLIRRRELQRQARDILRQVNLRPFQLDRQIRLFSGGNQQKIIIGRWIAANAQILLFDEPTRGIDVGAKAEIYGLIEQLAAQGKSVIVVSSELPEILRLSDRVLVMREGRIAADLPRSEMSEQAIVAHAVPQSESAGVAA